MEQLEGLYQRLKRFEQENAANPPPVQADFRLDAGFGTYENVALLVEYVSARLGRFLLAPAILAGLSSVLYWHWFDDLRFYYWIQLIPLLTVPAVIVLFRPKYSRQWLLLLALACYMLAKISETYDREVFAFSQSLFSGHSLKHILAASGCFSVLVMLKTRRPIDNESAP